MFHWHQVWKHMRNLTNKEIEKRAIMEIINHFEDQIDTVIKQSVNERRKLNEIREKQGLNSKSRIDEKCVKKAIKTINSNKNSSLSHDSEAGGETKRKEYDVKCISPKEEDFLSEVA